MKSVKERQKGQCSDKNEYQKSWKKIMMTKNGDEEWKKKTKTNKDKDKQN